MDHNPMTMGDLAYQQSQDAMRQSSYQADRLSALETEVASLRALVNNLIMALVPDES